MKYTCMNYEECDYYEYLTQQELGDARPYKSCPQCNSLAVLLPSSTNIKLLLEEPTVFYFHQGKIGTDAKS